MVNAVRDALALQSTTGDAELVVVTLPELRGLVAEIAERAIRTAMVALTAIPEQPTTPAALVEPDPEREPFPEGPPLVELVAARHVELCLSPPEVARRLEHVAKTDGDWCAATMQSVSAVERQGRISHPGNLRWLAVALELPPERLSQAAKRQRRKRKVMAARRQSFAQRRKSLGWSQEALAHHLGVERSTVARWERGETDPQPWMRPMIASALEIFPEQLDVLLTAAMTGTAWRDGMQPYHATAAPVPTADSAIH